MKVYRLLNLFSLCALLLSCAMPALGSATDRTLLIKNIIDANNHLDSLPKEGSPSYNQADYEAANATLELDKQALEDFDAANGGAAVVMHTPADATPEAPEAPELKPSEVETKTAAVKPAQKESYLAWTARKAWAPFGAAGRGIAATGKALGRGASAVGGTVANYTYRPVINWYSSSSSAPVVLPLAQQSQAKLLKTKFKNATLMSLQAEANKQIAANEKDRNIDPSAAVQAFMEAVQKDAQGIKILKGTQLAIAQKALKSAEDVYAAKRERKASERELDQAMSDMQAATEQLEVIKNGQPGLGGAEMPAFNEETLEFGNEGEVIFPATPEAELAAVKTALSAEGADMSHRQRHAAQLRALAEQPQRNARGALTGAGHIGRLEQRLAEETRRRIANSILANNSLPTASNLDQWVRQFVNVYTSPYVMAQLSNAEKEQYVSLIKDFFRKAYLSGDFDLQEVSLLYDRLIEASPRLQEAMQARLEPWMTRKVEESEQAFDAAREESDRAAATRAAAEKAAAANPSAENVAAVEKAKAAEQQAVQKTQSKLVTVLKWTAGAAVVGGATYLGISWLTGSDPKAVRENLGNLAGWAATVGGAAKDKVFGKKKVGDYDPEIIPNEQKSWAETLSFGLLGNQPKTATAATASAAPKKNWLEWASFGYLGGEPKQRGEGVNLSEGQMERLLDGESYLPEQPGSAPAASRASNEDGWFGGAQELPVGDGIVRPGIPSPMKPEAPRAPRASSADDAFFGGRAERPEARTVVPSAPEAPALTPSAPRVSASAASAAGASAGGLINSVKEYVKGGMKFAGGVTAYNQAVSESTKAMVTAAGGNLEALKKAAKDLGVEDTQAMGEGPLKRKIADYYKLHPYSMPTEIVGRYGAPVALTAVGF